MLAELLRHDLLLLWPCSFGHDIAPSGGAGENASAFALAIIYNLGLPIALAGPTVPGPW